MSMEKNENKKHGTTNTVSTFSVFRDTLHESFPKNRLITSAKQTQPSRHSRRPWFRHYYALSGRFSTRHGLILVCKRCCVGQNCIGAFSSYLS